MFAGYCSGMGPGGWAVMAALWLGLIVAAVWLVGRLFPRAGDPAPEPDPREQPAHRS